VTSVEEDVAHVVASVGVVGESFRLESTFGRLAVVGADAAALGAIDDALRKIFDDRVLARIRLFERSLPGDIGRASMLSLDDDARLRAERRVGRRRVRIVASGATRARFVPRGRDVLLVDDRAAVVAAVGKALGAPRSVAPFGVGGGAAGRVMVMVHPSAAVAAVFARPFLSVICPAAKAFGHDGVFTALAREDPIGACDVAIVATP
jgi:hypothetical protein